MKDSLVTSLGALIFPCGNFCGMNDFTSIISIYGYYRKHEVLSHSQTLNNIICELHEVAGYLAAPMEFTQHLAGEQA